ncbi:poly(A)-specific ribonuclease PARN-like isoform X2 [Daucus carota subsp. sativus]|uniref:poly(A)-specific ribonuclease PARN-like isoform X2 n=1 Tax=Daucus carota subsp. sativus TaxID=79200 RepID=UPI0007EFC6CE|nr:PREDICTED: poly(A)-specific ribonuclease PARN-like isoform X2 [Daucus carota subsp. sativus]
MSSRRPPWLLQRRFITTNTHTKPTSNPTHNPKWCVKQVSKSNFSETLENIKDQILKSDYIAVSLKKTGSHSAPWHRTLPIDTAQTAYLKAKYAAERFQLFQFAVCPFSIRDSKLIAYPYNFHLFPRDGLKLGMPCYSFMCQSSYLTSMANEGFDFNACINDGISYLSRAQELIARNRRGNPVISNLEQSSSPHSVADSLFLGRIQSRVKSWLKACKESKTGSEDALIRSLRKLMVGSEEYGSRPCLRIDVCSERHVQLALEVLKEFADDVVPMVIRAKGGGIQAVQVVLTSSKEDKDIFEEQQCKEEDQNKLVRGFREVIDLISASQKPLVAQNSLNDFTIIHSKFLGPLPPSMDEFRTSLHLAVPHVLDISHLMDEISPLKKLNSVSAATSYMKRRFFAPIDAEIPQKVEADESKSHGYDVLRISQLFAKICSVLKISSETDKHSSSALKGYANIFNPYSASSDNHMEEDVRLSTDHPQKISTENIVFVWGFTLGTSAKMLRNQLLTSSEVLSDEFDVRILDKSCAVIAFSKPDSSTKFLEAMESGGNNCDSLSNLISEGLRAADYETYKRVCSLGLWEVKLADSLDKALETDFDGHTEDSQKESTEVYWRNSDLINLDEL